MSNYGSSPSARRPSAAYSSLHFLAYSHIEAFRHDFGRTFIPLFLLYSYCRSQATLHDKIPVAPPVRRAGRRDEQEGRKGR